MKKQPVDWGKWFCAFCAVLFAFLLGQGCAASPLVPSFPVWALWIGFACSAFMLIVYLALTDVSPP